MRHVAVRADQEHSHVCGLLWCIHCIDKGTQLRPAEGSELMQSGMRTNITDMISQAYGLTTSAQQHIKTSSKLTSWPTVCAAFSLAAVRS